MRKVIVMFLSLLSLSVLAQEGNGEVVSVPDLFSEASIVFKIDTLLFKPETGNHKLSSFITRDKVRLLVMGATPSDVSYKEASNNVRKNKKSPDGDLREWKLLEGQRVLKAVEYYNENNVDKALLHYAKYTDDEKVIYFLVHVTPATVVQWELYFDKVIQTAQLNKL